MATDHCLSKRFSSLFGSSSASASASAGTDPTSALETPAPATASTFRWILWALLFVVVVWLVYLILKTFRINQTFSKFLASLPVPVQKWFAQLSPQQQEKIKTEVVEKKKEEEGPATLATGPSSRPPGAPPTADDAVSSIQTSHPSAAKAGWCYIGEERGIRTCAKVEDTDKCMSGNIFPSQDICVNPTLRP